MLDDLAGHEHDLRDHNQIYSYSVVHGVHHRFYGEVAVHARLNPLELYALKRGVLLQYHVDGVELSSRADHPWPAWQRVQHGTQTLPR